MRALVRDRVVRLVVAVVLLGIALQVSNGMFSRQALAFLLAAIISAGSAFGARRVMNDASLPVVFGAALAIDFALLATMRPGLYLQRPWPGDHPLFLASLACAAVAAALMLVDRARAGRVWFPLLLATSAALGIWMIHASPAPAIDVLTVHRAAIDALSSGRDPYGITFQNIYGHGNYYAPEMTAGGQVLFGFPYPPLSLLMALPGQLLLGDIRYAELAAMLGGAALLSRLPGTGGHSAMGPLAAALVLFTPRSLFVIEQGWTELFAVAWLGATMFAACRMPRALPWMLALLVSVKQQMLLALPLALLLVPRPFEWRAALRLLLPSLVVPCLFAVPFLVWNAGAFLDSVVWLQFREPFRSDSLSLLAGLRQAGVPLDRNSALTLVMPAAAVAAAYLVAWRFAPPTPAGFAMSTGFTLLLLFAANKKAFCNYYFFVIACLCAAIAADRGGSEMLECTGATRRWQKRSPKGW